MAEEVTDHELSFQRDQDDLQQHLQYFSTCLLCFWPIKLARPSAQAAPAGDKVELKVAVVLTAIP